MPRLVQKRTTPIWPWRSKIPVAPLNEVVPDRLNVDVCRGMHSRAGFCQAGMSPAVRERPAEQVSR